MTISVAEIVLAYIHTIYKSVVKIYPRPMLLKIGIDKCNYIKSFF